MAIRGIESITKVLEEYANGIGEIYAEETEAIAKASVKRLKDTSPVRKSKGGTYAAGWRLRRQGSKFIIHNATSYQLTHLLEKGHVKRGGVGRVAPIVHIAPVESQAINDLLDAIERRLS